METGEELGILPHPETVSAVAFLSDSRLVTGTSKGDLIVWELGTGHALERVNVDGPIRQISVSPGGGYIWCSTFGGVFALDGSTLAGVARYQVASGVAVARAQRHDGAYGVLRWNNSFELGSRDTIVLEWWHGSTRIEVGTPHEIEKKINSAALSSDGNIVILGTEDGVVHLLRGQGLNEVISIPGHSGSVESVDIAPNASSFASVGLLDKVIFIRNVESRNLIRRIDPPHGAFPNKVLYTPAGDGVLIANDEDDSAKLVSLKSGKDVIFGRTAVPVFKLQSDRSRNSLIVGTWYSAALWNLQNGRMTRQFPLSGSARAVAISPDGTRVFTGENQPFDYSRYLLALDVRTGTEVARYPHQAAVTSAVYSPDRKLLASGDTIGTIRIWDVNRSQEIKTLSGHSDAVTALSFGAMPDTLLSAASDHTLRVWDLKSGEERWREDFYGNDAEVFSPSGRLVVAWSPLRVIDVNTHKELVRIEGAWANFAFANDDVLLFVNKRESSLETWNRISGERKKITDIRDPQMVKLVPMPGTDTLVCEDRSVRVIDWSTGVNRHEFKDAICSATGAPFVLVDRADRSEVWNAITSKMQIRLRHPSHFYEAHFSVSADHRFMVTANRDFKVEVWDLKTGNRIRVTDDSYLRSDSARSALPALSANGDRYFVSTESGDVPMTGINSWTLQPDSKPNKVFTQPYAVESIDVSPDGEHFISCGGDETMRLVDANTGKVVTNEQNPCLEAKFSENGALVVSTTLNSDVVNVLSADLTRRFGLLDYHPNNVVHLAVSGDGSMMTVEGSGTVRLWDMNSAQEKTVMPSLEPKRRIEAVEFVLGHALALLGLETGEIRSWRTSSGDPGPTFNGHKAPIKVIRRAMSNDHIFLSLSDDDVRVWDIMKPQPLRVIESVGSKITAAALSQEGDLLVLADKGRRARIVQVSSGSVSQSIDLPSIAQAVAFGSDNKTLIAGCEDGVGRIIEIASGRTTKELRFPNSVPIISVESLGKLIIVTARSGTTLWNEQGEPLDEFDEGAPLVASRTFITAERTVVVINAGTGIYAASLGQFGLNRSTPLQEHVSSFAVSPDARQAAVGFSAGLVRVWDITTGSIVSTFRVGKGRVTKLAYSHDGALVLSTEDGIPSTWRSTDGKRLAVYGTSPDITDLSFLGKEDQFVVTASSDGRVRLFARDSATELCTLLLARNGEWLVVGEDGQYDGTDEMASRVLGVKSNGTTAIAGDHRITSRRHPTLLADITAGKMNTQVASVQAEGLPEMRSVHFDAVTDESPTRAEPPPDSSPPHGLGVELLVKLFADLLKAGDRITVNDSDRVQTSPDGRIEIGTQALEHAYKGQSFASSIGLTSFVVAHEVWHSRQAAKYHFGDLSDEDHRLLECQADVLGAMDSVKIVMASGTSKETVEAYAAIRRVQDTVARMSALEGSDSFHPSQSQREWAVEFGNARFAGRVVTDQDGLTVLDRRYNARAPGDDELWAQNVCKRILNYRLADQRDVSVSLHNERRIGGRWEAEVAYKNLSDHPLKINAHIRLVGTSFSILTGAPSAHLANIDGHLISFALQPGAEHTQSVSLAEIELPGERVQASGILYTSAQQDNWMSVESETETSHARSNSVESKISLHDPSRKMTCAELELNTVLTERQQELGEFLFMVGNHAVDGFQSLRHGTALPLDPTDGSRGFIADVRLSGAQEPTIIVDSQGNAELSVTLGKGLARSEADQLFGTTASDLRVLCPHSTIENRSALRDQIGYESIVIQDFAPNAEVSLTRFDFKEPSRSQVSISVTAKGNK